MIQNKITVTNFNFLEVLVKFWLKQPWKLSVTPWTAILVCTWDTAVDVVENWATWGYSACETHGNNDPKLEKRMLTVLVVGIYFLSSETSYLWLKNIVLCLHNHVVRMGPLPLNNSSNCCMSLTDPMLTFRACLQGGRVAHASRLTLTGGQKIARVYKQNFTGRVTLQARTTLSEVTQTIRKLTWV